jgi:hypothetical protein
LIVVGLRVVARLPTIFSGRAPENVESLSLVRHNQ